MSKHTPSKKKKRVKGGAPASFRASGAAGKVGIAGPPWLVLAGLVFVGIVVVYFGFLGFTLITTGHAADLNLVLRGN
ncbi:hypothetical protein [Curtobacterium flaccumfaciens]|uniref:hypothetical protein n=1 Tax=Curtobacterium flaccumfaciens TaxID=2035 RepID=UPI001E35DED7|nr:hypothetical protein [Curtobacterium allii]MCE0459509.1 hypothetical protein [Curtobacterium allii]